MPYVFPQMIDFTGHYFIRHNNCTGENSCLSLIIYKKLACQLMTLGKDAVQVETTSCLFSINRGFFLFCI